MGNIKKIVENMIKSYIENDEKDFVISGDNALAEEIEIELKKKGVKMSYIIDNNDLLIEIDAVYEKYFESDSAADAMLKFLDHMRWKMGYKLLTNILHFPITSAHIEKIDILKRVFWYEKIPKKFRA